MSSCFTPMQTRSSLAIQILVDREKKRSERKKSELEELVQTAGVDRPDISKFTDSAVRTRRRTKERVRSQFVQVVIESPGTSRGSGLLSVVESKTQITSDTPTDLNQIRSPATSTASTTESDRTENQRAEEGFGGPRPHSIQQPALAASRPGAEQNPATQKTSARQVVLEARRRRKQLKAIRRAIDWERRNRPIKSRSSLLDGLKKALAKLERPPERYSPTTLSNSPGNQFTASAGLIKPLKKVKLIPRRLLDISLKHQSKHFTISLAPCSSALKGQKPGAQRTLPISLPLPQDSQYNAQPQNAGRESRSSITKKDISGTISVPSPSSVLLASHIKLPDMGTPRKSSKRANSSRAKEALSGTGMSDERRVAHEISSQDHAMTDVSEYQDEQLPKATFPLTDECKHYTHISQVDWDIQK